MFVRNHSRANSCIKKIDRWSLCYNNAIKRSEQREEGKSNAVVCSKERDKSMKFFFLYLLPYLEDQS